MILPQKTYFMIYMAFFLTMGFYIKFIYYNYYKLNNFFELVANFSFTNREFDDILFYIDICILGMIAGGYFSGKINFNKKKSIIINIKNQHLIIYTIIVLIVCIFNFYFSIYQKAGVEYNDSLLTKAISWLLFMGFTGLILIIAQFEEKINLIKIFFYIILIEFFIQVSTLSRSYIITSSAILLSLGIFQIKNNIFNIKKYSLIIITSLVLFIISIYSVNIIRIVKYNIINSDKTVELLVKDPRIQNITNMGLMFDNFCSCSMCCINHFKSSFQITSVINSNFWDY